MKYHFILIIIFASACKEQPRCTITINKLLNKSERVIYIDSLNGTSEIIDLGIDTIIGGRYVFYPNGQLRSYKFFSTELTYTYSEDYSLNGNLERTEGNPLIYKIVKEEGRDSAFFKFYLLALNKEYENIQVRFNDSARVNVLIGKDSTFSNTKLMSFGMNIKGLQEIAITSEIVYRDLCTNEIKKFIDTLQLTNEVSK